MDRTLNNKENQPQHDDHPSVPASAAAATTAALSAAVAAVVRQDRINKISQKEEDDDDDDNDDDDDDKNGVTESLAPSHILEDGRFIYLPPPSIVEHSKFFERSIARHGLLQADMASSSTTTTTTTSSSAAAAAAAAVVKKVGDDGKDAKQEEEEDDKTAPKVHPLAVASAKLQANGLMELNRAINLAQLVTTGEYFGLTNIVDPSLETSGAETTTTTTTKKTTTATTTSSSSTTTSSSVVAPSAAQSIDTIQSTFVLKRKKAQFQRASTTLERHVKRLKQSIQAQRVLDRRLLQLRQQWRLVAPEHGTRARLHATRPTEIVAIDVDVYDRDRVGGGINKAASGNPQQSLAGRLASRVPRFATIEWQEDQFSKLQEEQQESKGEEAKADNKSPDDEEGKEEKKEDVDQMDVDETSAIGDDGKKKENDDVKMEQGDQEMEVKRDLSKCTRAEPFAVADPTLGRVLENFDPSKVPMLNLQLDIQKASTGFLQSSCLEPVTTLSVAQGTTRDYAQDEALLVSLQHSLFCASLFESIRHELEFTVSTGTGTGTTSTTNPTQFSAVRNNAPPVAWLACESEQNFLPPPNRRIQGGYGLSALTVVHCHEGEVKVQLDSEYTLCVKLVEAKAEDQDDKHEQVDTSMEASSGSQSPQQLHALCRALLLHAQDVYHRHSLYLREQARQKEEEARAQGSGPKGLARVSKEDVLDQARILQSCVSLGSKLLFEQRVRKTLVRMAKWLKSQTTDNLQVDWLALSVFDLQSHFTLCFRQLVLDVHIARDDMMVTQIAEGGVHRKAHFHSDAAFAVFLKLELRRQLRSS